MLHTVRIRMSTGISKVELVARDHALIQGRPPADQITPRKEQNDRKQKKNI